MNKIDKTEYRKRIDRILDCQDDVKMCRIWYFLKTYCDMTGMEEQNEREVKSIV